MTTPRHEHPATIPLLTLPVGPTSAPGALIVSGNLRLAGWSLKETTGAAAATVDLIDGGDANGLVVATIDLQASESIRDTVGGHLLVIRTGLFLAVSSGTVRGSLWVANRGTEER